MNPGAAPRIQRAMHEAQTSYQRGQLKEAATLCRQVLKWAPGHLDAVNLAGIVAAQAGLPKAALEHFTSLVRLIPDSAMAHTNRGTALMTLGRPDAALAAFDKALRLDPTYVIALNNRGNALRQLRDPAGALACYERALQLQPGNADIHHNQAHVLADLGRTPEALQSLNRTLELNPMLAAASLQRGNLLSALGRHADALADYEQSLRRTPNEPEAHNNRGNALLELGRREDALGSFRNAVSIKPDYAEAYFNGGNLLREQHDYLQAATWYARAFELKPQLPFLRGAWRNTRMQLCDWADFDADAAALTLAIEHGECVVPPFFLLALLDDPRLQRRAAEIWARTRCAIDEPCEPVSPRIPRERLRIGYFSADFRNHAVAALLAELIELHDRKRFEIIAFSFGSDDEDELRARIRGAVDHFCDVRACSDRDIVRQARQLGLDIAIDLGGYTQAARPKIFAHRVAPVQVSYLGYLGTVGSDCIDYLITDAVISPPGSEPDFSECLLRLPSYQVNDRRRQVDARTPTRKELGLPAEGIVFCCLNASYKITPQVFKAWMRILTRTLGSVLMVLGDIPAVVENLRAAAQQHGVSPERVVFARRMPSAQYIAAYRAMDLFLDTFPYNAGTTASDALRVGLPVLTRSGQSFAARVAASVLNAAGVPELITTTTADYENRAVELAHDPGQLAGIRERLITQINDSPLFDTDRFASALESAFLQIHRRAQTGLAPDHISVASA